MIVYVLMIIISCFIAFLACKNRDKKLNCVLFVLTFFPLFLVSAIRYNVGRDYLDTYVYTFNKILYGASNIRIDLGFYLLNKLIIIFNGSYQWVFIISSFVINFFICRSLYEQSEDKFLSVFIYVCGTLFFFSLNGVRQSMALSLFYYSLKYIEKRDFKKYFIINLIGALLHNSAIIFIPLYFVLSKKIKLRYKLLVIFAISIFLPSVLSILNSFLMSTKYSMYLTNGAYNPLKTINVSTIINILLFAFYEVFSSINIDENKKSKINIYSNIHFIGIVVSMFTTKISLAMRIFMYFRYIEYLSVPYLIDNINLKKGNKCIIKLLIVIIYLFYFIHGVYIENGNSVLPYQTYYFNEGVNL